MFGECGAVLKLVVWRLMRVSNAHTYIHTLQGHRRTQGGDSLYLPIMHTQTHTYTHTYITTYIHTYIHTYIQGTSKIQNFPLAARFQAQLNANCINTSFSGLTKVHMQASSNTRTHTHTHFGTMKCTGRPASKHAPQLFVCTSRPYTHARARTHTHTHTTQNTHTHTHTHSLSLTFFTKMQCTHRFV
jgi:hypothetical protein